MKYSSQRELSWTARAAITILIAIFQPITSWAQLFHLPRSSPNQSEHSPEPGLTDLPKDPSERAAIDRMLARGILVPKTATRFFPDVPMTRAEFAMAMQHMFNLGKPARPVIFPDLSPQSSVYIAVQAITPYLHTQILCAGCVLNRDFLPDRAITRDQATVILVSILIVRHTLNLLTGAAADRALARVTDVSRESPAARAYFATAVKNGLLIANRANKLELGFEPSRESIAILFRPDSK
jgi:S-layer homology domain